MREKATHGSVSFYKNHGCRCPSCREAWSVHSKARWVNRKDRAEAARLAAPRIFPPARQADPKPEFAPTSSWWTREALEKSGAIKDVEKEGLTAYAQRVHVERMRKAPDKMTIRQDVN